MEQKGDYGQSLDVLNGALRYNLKSFSWIVPEVGADVYLPQSLILSAGHAGDLVQLQAKFDPTRHNIRATWNQKTHCVTESGKLDLHKETKEGVLRCRAGIWWICLGKDKDGVFMPMYLLLPRRKMVLFHARNGEYQGNCKAI